MTKNAPMNADARPETALPLAEFQELVGQYHHRLLSLEADLKDQARSGLVAPRSFARRVKRLAGVHDQLEALRQLCKLEEPAQMAAADIGLPLLSECTPAEHATCAAFLKEKADDYAQMIRDTERVYTWLTEAVRGRTGPLSMTLRLSRLQRLIQSLEERQQSMQTLDDALAERMDTLLPANRRKDQRNDGDGAASGRATLEGLMALFRRMDATTQRVARLKATVKSEDGRVQAMVAWLAKEDQALAAANPPMPAPTPLTVQRAKQDSAQRRTTAERPRRRRLLTQFWDEVMLRGQRVPSNSAPLDRAAAQLAPLLQTAGAEAAQVPASTPRGQRSPTTSVPAQRASTDRASADTGPDTDEELSVGAPRGQREPTNRTLLARAGVDRVPTVDGEAL